MSGWTALRFRFPEPLEDAALGVLSEAGTLGVTLQDAEPPSRFAVAYFPEGKDLRLLLAALERLGLGEGIAMYRVGEEPWVERQEASRLPLRIGSRFVILPARGAALSGENRIRLLVPPRRAFGTGEHPTTRLCLELLESESVHGERILDFGTGSAILALGASALGAKEVVAVDVDPEAVEMARENVALREEGHGPILVREGGLEVVSGRFDLVLANILAGVLEDAADRIAALQEGGGRAILSGFSPEDADAVLRAYEGAGYRAMDRRTSEEWAALRVARREIGRA